MNSARGMKRVVLILALLVAAGAALAWVLSAPNPRFSEAEWQALGLTGDAAAGRLVFFAGGCDSCHKSPGQDDPLRLGGGLELKTAFGSFYPPNISSDRNDGIGGWRPVDIANALAFGRFARRPQPLSVVPLPVVPADDAEGRRRPRRLPAHVAGGSGPGAGERSQVSLFRSPRRGLMEAALFRRRRPSARFLSSPEWNRGRYLVEGPGHCGECHTPRNFLGADGRNAERSPDAPLPDGHGKAPNLRGGDFLNWTNADIVEALTSGFTPAGDVLGAGMTAVVRNLAELPAGRPRGDRRLSEEPAASRSIRVGQAVTQHRVGGGPMLIPIDHLGFLGPLAVSCRRPRLTGVELCLDFLGFSRPNCLTFQWVARENRGGIFSRPEKRRNRAPRFLACERARLFMGRG